MTKKPRYTLLILGILFFSVAAPTLVLYVQGKLPVGGNRHMQPTGIISATSDPSGAEVYVDSQLEDTTPASVRFVPTGDYTIQLHKKGYWDWQKRLSVVAGHVTYANPNPEKQILLKRETPQELASDVSLYTTHKNGIAYVTGSTLTLMPDIDEPEQITRTTLPEPPLELLSDPVTDLIGIRTAGSFFIFNPTEASLTTLPKPIADVNQLLFTQASILILTNDHNLYTLPREKLNTKPLLLGSSIDTFRVRESDIYYIQKKSQTGELHHATITPTGLSNDQLLTHNVPAQAPALYIDTTKAVFVHDDKTLYRVNAQPEIIANNITTVSDHTGTLSYTAAGELWWYDSNSNTGRLVSRNGEGFREAIVQPSLQYALFAQGTQLIALELDDRGEQNRYVLDTANTLSSLHYINNTSLTYLAGNSLRVLTLR